MLNRKKAAKAFQLALSYLSAFWALPLVAVIRMIRPFKIIRLGPIRSDRIGHFVQDACEQKARLVSQRINTVDIFWLPTKTCNQQWRRMVCRTLNVSKFAKFIDFWNRKIPNGELNSRPSTYSGSRDVEGLFSNYDAGLTFSLDESVAARKWMSSVGLTENDEHVCLLVRDSSYLTKDKSLGGRQDSKDQWSYHNYRDSNIETYEPAIKWLLQQGVWVFRMGRIMEKPISFKHPRLVDYAFRSDQSDLMDIWLFATCKFCISTSGGPDSLSPIYRRPILYLNASPLGHLMSYWDSVWTPKNLVWEKTGTPLTLTDYLEHTYFSSLKFAKAGVLLRDLNEDEILEGTQEFWARKFGTWPRSKDDEVRHEKFWEKLKAWERFGEFHRWIHPESDVSTVWLRRQGDEFFD